MPHSPVATLTATELAKDPARFAGAWVIVKGKAKGGPKSGDIFDNESKHSFWTNLTFEQEGTPVACTGFREPNGGQPLKAGEEMEIWGKVLGLSADKKYVFVTDCMTLKPAIEVEAVDLFDEFQKDEAAATKKYRFRSVLISGVVKKTGQRLLIQGSRDASRRSIDCPDALLTPGVTIKEGDRVVILMESFLYGEVVTGLHQIAGTSRLVSGGR